MPRSHAVDVTPSARRLTASLRDIGYDFLSAVADLVDNSVSAEASRVDVVVSFDGEASRVVIADDGRGMTEAVLREALRFGSRRDYESGDLGRFGLGLKTASLSQCRKVTVVTRHAPRYRRISALTLDLERISSTDRWVVYDPWDNDAVQTALEWLDESTGTVVIWEILDRVLPDGDPNGSWAQRKFQQLAARISEYLGMVFHRFLEGPSGRGPLTITVNGEKLRPWDPFATDEAATVSLPHQVFEVSVGAAQGDVGFRGFVLPNRDRFSSLTEFERLSGPRKWNRQQGLYIYRADRLVQGGGWSGIRSIDEHTKLARAALDFPTELDAAFRINVAKMRVSLPVELRAMIERPIHELAHRADSIYRRDKGRTGEGDEGQGGKDADPPPRALHGAAIALRSAAMEVDEYDALERVMAQVTERAPEVAQSLGW